MKTHIKIQDLNVWYRGNQALRDISADIPAGEITAVIGPSGCGKSTLLKCLNRLHEEQEDVRVTGKVWLNGTEIFNHNVDVYEIRTRIGMLAPKPFDQCV